MIITTTERIEGMKVTKTLGLVRGNTTRIRHVGRDIMVAFRNVVGGEVTEYTKLMAESLGANVVVSTRFVTSMAMSGAAELVAY